MISYSVYLLHPLVFDAYRSVPALHRPHTVAVQALLFAGCVAVVISLSAVTYYSVEKPMQRLGRRFAGRRTGPAPPGTHPPGTYPAGAAAGSRDAETAGSSGRDTDSERPGAPAAARSASSSSVVAGGSGASP
jgi:peptidoglycan/LPS O-acetylase OafA/YrhL